MASTKQYFQLSVAVRKNASYFWKRFATTDGFCQTQAPLLRTQSGLTLLNLTN